MCGSLRHTDIEENQSPALRDAWLIQEHSHTRASVRIILGGFLPPPTLPHASLASCELPAEGHLVSGSQTMLPSWTKGHTSQPRPLLLCLLQGSMDICIKHHKSQHLKAGDQLQVRTKSRNGVWGWGWEEGRFRGGSLDGVGACGWWQWLLSPLSRPPRWTPPSGFQALHSVCGASQQARELVTTGPGDLGMLMVYPECAATSF